MNSIKVLLFAFLCSFTIVNAQRTERLLERNWRFIREDIPEAAKEDYDDARWQTVDIPHDWAIYGPFDRNNDLQHVTVTQNLEKQASVKTGRTGGLPYAGVGWYRTHFSIPAGNPPDKRVNLVFDGAMSEARIFVNGKETCYWPYGYNSFYCDITDFIHTDTDVNTLAVRLENKPQSSRWYSGSGLYRNVHLITTGKVHVPVWGTYVTTPHVSEAFASICLQTTVENAGSSNIRIETQIVSSDGTVVAEKKDTRKINHEQPFEQNFIVNTPQLWSPETPYLYKAVSKIYAD
ncbi:MAG: beta galactosidase jelly roll domain-containing protein, partial [Candidatus Azobacteroides sp.]|nr:beta galactosidase jelly roll domain-containing protein [Candidatus Azobacteroides sp.]